MNTSSTRTIVRERHTYRELWITDASGASWFIVESINASGVIVARYEACMSRGISWQVPMPEHGAYLA